MTAPGRTVAVVLAAGAGQRFGGSKLAAPLEGKPLLQHVLDALVEAGLARVVVVLGWDPAVEAAVRWRGERRVTNRRPADGLSGSLRLGLAQVAGQPDVHAALIVLADQPRLRPEVIRALLNAPTPRGTLAVVPRYAGGGGRNPVLLLRAGFALAHQAHGDAGLGALLAARPEMVHEVVVEGDNPDVDTAEDLAALAAPDDGPGDALRPGARALEAAWAARVAANAEQVAAMREDDAPEDHWAPLTGLFVADPRRSDEPLLDTLRALVRPDEVVLDVGAGAGRYALPLALHTRRVIAVEPSAGMLAELRQGMTDHGIDNVEVVQASWPMDHPPVADVALIAHVGYDIAAIGPFLDALEAAARRLCLALLMERPPPSGADPLWAAVHGQPRRRLPALPEFLALLLARGRLPEVRLHDREPRAFADREALLGFLRRQLWLRPGSAKDRRLGELVAELPAGEDGSVRLESAPRTVGVVSWSPR
ncbi:MAG TPA: NTP transferase domain-containing protein [Candidatus Limnocylindrales bacterium]|nr:NTP transferase domain-containing protein [Candidatus Limnocylindrales bacterium]